MRKTICCGWDGLCVVAVLDVADEAVAAAGEAAVETLEAVEAMINYDQMLIAGRQCNIVLSNVCANVRRISDKYA
jgi:hypothetical protein